MTVRVVTDSCCDIPQEDAKKLGITVVPVYLRFGEEVYRDGVDIDSQEFYRKLMTSSVHPSTAAPSPGDFAKVYDEMGRETDEIVSIHITEKHSATFNAALLGKEIAAKKGRRIEVIDSKGVTMWQGLAAMAAAKLAEARFSLSEVLEEVHETIGRLRVLALLDTIKYILKGGRLGKVEGGRLAKVISKIESILNVKLLLTLRDGELRPAGVVRTQSKGTDRLREFIKSALPVKDLAIVYSTTLEEAQALADSIRLLLPEVVPQLVRLGPALGVHAGPGALIAVVNGAK